MKTPFVPFALLFTMLATPLPAQTALMSPDSARDSVPRKPEPARWIWGRPEAQLTPKGDLVWAPEPFKFEAGKSVRYIDFDAGNDANDGASKAKPWKHHPWDPAATGLAKACNGIQTYVFKRGVVYRGTMVTQESGEERNPIRLTSDPAWGKGEAVITGAEQVTGWKLGADNNDIPDKSKVWYVDLPFAPRNVWEVTRQGVERIQLARTPNYKVSDPEDVLADWNTWEQPQWWTGRDKTVFGGHKAHLGIDTKNLKGPAAIYVGAIVRSGYGIVMSTPFPSRVEGFDEKEKALIFQGIWFGDSERIVAGNHYMLEDKPQFLDAPGEFWFDKKGDGGRLYLRLPGDVNPATVDVEVARHINLIESKGISHLVVSGLTFCFTNTYWDLTLAAWGHPDVANAAVRIRGAAEDVTVANCKFEHISGRPVIIAANPEGATVDRIVIRDNEMLFADHGAVLVEAKGPGDVEFLRNRLYMIGLRPYRQGHGHAIEIRFAATQVVAGNIMDRCYGSGIFLFGGKPAGSTEDAPLSRLLVFNNRAVDTLLAACDWGGIETWQGGPHYLFNNISGNPNGRWWGYHKDKPGSARLGFAYYHDGGHKVYSFNNVAWGDSVNALDPRRAAAAFYQATPNVENAFFNNTAYAFHLGSNWSPAGGRQLMLSNIWEDISGVVFQHGQLKEDTGPAPAAYEHDSTAMAGNVFSEISAPVFGLFEATGKSYPNLAEMKKAMESHHPLAGTIGTMTPAPVLADAKGHDFHPRPASPASNQGAKVFVPWSVARTVGEWHFRCNRDDPATILDSHWYLTPYAVERETYYKLPRYPLKAPFATVKSFTPGPLEDWTATALTVNGVDQFASAAHADMTKPYSFTGRVAGKPATQTVSGNELATPDVEGSNLMIEVFFRTEPGHTGGTIVSKLSDAGYLLGINKAGGATLLLRAGGKTGQLAAGVKINDGKWHHLLAEVDRTAGTATIYVDGVSAATGTMAVPDSLSNTADLLVGKGPDGGFFAGQISYLRIARSMLAESKTSIAELYDWEFDGPFLRDFAGRTPAGARRTAGAFEPAR